MIFSICGQVGNGADCHVGVAGSIPGPTHCFEKDFLDRAIENHDLIGI